jgi:hypothetical protein
MGATLTFATIWTRDAGQPLGANNLLNVVLPVTTTQASVGFYGSVIIGDPPAPRSSVSQTLPVESIDARFRPSARQ